MELKNAIYGRRSIRQFKSNEVSKENLQQLIDVGIHAPSSKNAQPWAFAVVQDAELLQEIAKEAKDYMLHSLGDSPSVERYRNILQNPAFNIFYNAPALLTIYTKSEMSLSEGGSIPEYDGCMAAENVMLMAHSLGLGTCWIGFAMPFLNSEKGKEKLNIPNAYVAVAPLVIGYPANSAVPAVPRADAKIFLWK